MKILNQKLRTLILILVSTCSTVNATAIEQTENTTASDISEYNKNEIVVIVNLNNTVNVISANEVRKLYLGKSRKFSVGGLVKLASLDQLSTRFNKTVLRKSDAQVDSIWSRLRFSGRAKPPTKFNDPEELLSYVSTTENAIGFILRSSINSMIKPVLSIK